MLSSIVQSIAEELNLVEDMVKRQLTIKSGHIGSFAHLELSYTNKIIRPALVILSSRIYGREPEKTAALASAFQFIYMGSKVHQGVSEKDSDYIRGSSDPRDGSQFPVLVGDYLYGKFFAFLSGYGMVNLLCPLAQIICEIHEGSILRSKLNGQRYSSKLFREVVRKETAEIFAGCCFISASIAGAPKKAQELMKRFGLNLGMAYGLMECGVPVEKTAVYLETARNALSMVPRVPERDVLEEIIQYLSGSGVILRKMVI